MHVPLEGRQMPDPLQVAVAELHHIKQSLLLLTAQHTERLRVEVLQQGQLHRDKTARSFATYVDLTYRRMMDKICRSDSVTWTPLMKFLTEKSW